MWHGILLVNHNVQDLHTLLHVCFLLS